MDGSDLAYPVKYLHDEDFYTTGGFTKRELIAAMAMQGLLAGAPIYDPSGVARTAVAYADALIERLSVDLAEGANDGK